LTVDVDDLIDEFLEEKEYVEFRKPYWLFLDSQEEMGGAYSIIFQKRITKGD